MKKYLHLALHFFKISLMADLEYRMNFVTRIGTDVIWYAAQLGIFEVLFLHTKDIAGWTIDSMRFFMGVLFVVDAIYMVLFHENLDRLSDKVAKGELDMLLVKPVNSQFMISLKKMSTAYLGNILLSVSWLLYSAYKLPDHLWPNILYLFLLIPCSVMIPYCIRLFFGIFALIFVRAENVNYLWYELYRLGTRPDNIYPTWLRYLVLTIIPVAFIASIPAQMAIHGPNPLLILGSWVITLIFLFVINRFWNFALKKYSSASS